ncbi:MAG: hypothetical protein ACFFAY_11370, partial [Promethearchaeota archaeon]
MTAMIEQESFSQHQSFRRTIRERIFLGCVVAILIGTTILVITPSNELTFGVLSVGDESLGTVGHSISDQSSSGQTEFLLLNTTDFTLDAGWITRATPNDVGYVKSYQDTGGFHVEGSYVSFTLHCYLNIIVDHYDALEVSSHVVSESGNFTFGISSYFGLWW